MKISQKLLTGYSCLLLLATGLSSGCGDSRETFVAEPQNGSVPAQFIPLFSQSDSTVIAKTDEVRIFYFDRSSELIFSIDQPIAFGNFVAPVHPPGAVTALVELVEKGELIGLAVVPLEGASITQVDSLSVQRPEAVLKSFNFVDADPEIPLGHARELLIDAPVDDAVQTFFRRFVTWTSDNPNVARVQNGTLQAVGQGTTQVRATLFDRTISTSVEVTAAPVTDQDLIIPAGNHTFDTNQGTLDGQTVPGFVRGEGVTLRDFALEEGATLQLRGKSNFVINAERIRIDGRLYSETSPIAPITLQADAFLLTGSLENSGAQNRSGDSGQITVFGGDLQLDGEIQCIGRNALVLEPGPWGGYGGYATVQADTLTGTGSINCSGGDGATGAGSYHTGSGGMGGQAVLTNGALTDISVSMLAEGGDAGEDYSRSGNLGGDGGTIQSNSPLSAVVSVLGGLNSDRTQRASSGRVVIQ